MAEQIIEIAAVSALTTHLWWGLHHFIASDLPVIDRNKRPLGHRMREMTGIDVPPTSLIAYASMYVSIYFIINMI